MPPRSNFLPALALALLLPAAVLGQERQIIVQNLSTFPRRDWAVVTVPFPQGAVKGMPDLHVGEAPTVWQPIGARWSDGSLRQALCLFPIEMQGVSETVLPLRDGAGPPLPDGKIVDPLREPSTHLEIAVVQGATTATARPTFVRELESNGARRVSLYRCRVGSSGFVFEVVVSACLGREHCDLDLGLFFSDPTSKAMEAKVDRVVVTTRGIQLALRQGPMFGMTTRPEAGGSQTVLLRDTTVGDGQGIRRSGVLAPRPDGTDPQRDQTLKAAVVVPLLAATNWQASGAYGPFGVVPDPPPWLQGSRGRAAFARRHAATVRAMGTPGHPFARQPNMLMKNPGATGNQSDFGILRLAPVASTGTPSFLLEVEPSVLQEACRPVHFFETDGAPVQPKAHPKWVVWDGRTHWNCSVSPDRLGKPCPAPRFEAHGWRGKDRQHWSSNYLCGYYLLTGSQAARREIENEVRLFLAAQTVRDVSTSGTGAARAIGRTLMVGCWLYQCTGDAALLQRIHDRLDRVYAPGWSGRDLPEGAVRPMVIRGPDRGQLGGAVRYWIPWEESLAAIGFAAAYRTTGNPVAGQLAEAIAMNTLRHGWSVSASGVHVGYRLKFQTDGKPLTDAQLLAVEPTVCKFGGGGLSAWSMGAVELALEYARERKDTAMVTKAERILAALRRATIRPPADGWWDPYREWDAVRAKR